MHRKLFLDKRMYFTRRFDTANLPIRYIALYEKGTGIGWYGEVVGWEQALRRKLPGQSALGDETYHVFRVLEWHAFEKPISVSEHGPNPTAYTNYFLLSNSSSYSELLLKSEADYRFFTELKRRTDEAVIKQSDESTAFEFGAVKVLFNRSNIRVYVGNKQVTECAVREFSKYPNATFRRLQKYAEGIETL